MIREDKSSPLAQDLHGKRWGKAKILVMVSPLHDAENPFPRPNTTTFIRAAPSESFGALGGSTVISTALLPSEPQSPLGRYSGGRQSVECSGVEFLCENFFHILLGNCGLLGAGS